MNYRKLLCACLAALMLLACGLTALAKVPSPSKEFYYYDEAGVLSEATKGEIFYSNQLLDKACGAQIVVAAVRTTGSEAISEYTNELFNSWGIGDAKSMNGMLLVLAIDDDDYYAVCGYNLQPKFTSSTLKDYYDRYLEDDFAAGRYDAGVKKFFEAAFERVATTYNAEVTTADGIAAYQAWVAEGSNTGWSAQAGGGSMRGDYEDDDDFPIMMMAFVVIVLIFMLMFITRARRRRMSARPVIVQTPPPPMSGPVAGPGGYRGANVPPPTAGQGGYRGPQPQPRIRTSRSSDSDWLMMGLLNGLMRGSGGGSRRGSSSSSSHSSSSRTSSRSSRSFGSASGGGGRTGGGGAGRGRH